MVPQKSLIQSLRRQWNESPYLVLGVICTLCICLITIMLATCGIAFLNVVSGKSELWVNGGLQVDLMDWPATSLEVFTQ